jgi:ubiquinol-cytochrome c reductase iron-sulfur subunit
VRLLRRILAALLALRLLRARSRRRPEPVDPSERTLPASPRSEWLVVAMLLVTAVAGAAFVVIYMTDGSNQLYGLALGAAFGSLAVALGVASARVVPQVKQAEPVHIPVDPRSQEAVEEHLRSAGQGVTRRRAIAGAAGLAGAGLGAALVAPAASLGPNVGRILEGTPWARGRYLVDEAGRRISADDLAVGDFVTAFPEGLSHVRRERTDAPVVLVRLRPDELHMPADRVTWTPEGLVAYSQICTHAGCAVSMFRYPLNEETSHGPALACPCHYSTFDPRRAARVTFGPAGRPLPQLPLALDAQRMIQAAGGFSGAPGPSWPGLSRRPL